MNCKYCNTRLKEDMDKCPNCGKKVNSNKNGGYIFVIAVVAVIISLVFIIVYNNKDNLNSQENKKVEQSSTSADSDEIITLDNYSFKVPSDYVAQRKTNNDHESISFFSTDNSSTITLSIYNQKYEAIKNSLKEIISSFEKTGYKLDNSEIKTIDDVEFIIFEMDKDNEKVLMGFTKLDENNSYLIGVANKDFEIDYDLYKVTVEIINSAK